MTEYIKREEVLALTHYDGIGLTRWEVVEADDIKAIPAADVAPVVHGKWIRKGYACGENEWKCSNCGETEWRTSSSRMKYCMFCGAKMDLEE